MSNSQSHLIWYVGQWENQRGQSELTCQADWATQGQIDWGKALNITIVKHGILEFNVTQNWQPVQIVQKWYDMTSFPLAEYNASNIVLSYLEIFEQVVMEIYRQTITIAQLGQYACQHKLLGGSNREMSDVADPAQLKKNELACRQHKEQWYVKNYSKTSAGLAKNGQR